LTLTLGQRVVDLGLCTAQAVLFLLVGGAMMMLIDWTARRLGSGRVTLAQYFAAMALSSFLGLFLQWEENYRNAQQLKTQNESLSIEVASLRKDLETKNTNLETLERRFDKFTAELTEIGKDTGKTMHALQEKLKQRDGQIASLQNQLNGKTRKKVTIRNHLTQLQAEGKSILDEAISNPTAPLPAAEREQWFATTIQYLRQNLETRHVEEFRHPSAPAVHFEGLPGSHDVFAGDLDTRLKVLQNFTDELRETN